MKKRFAAGAACRPCLLPYNVCVTTSVAILGGGLAGLALARKLKDAGLDSVVLEAQPSVGGLCRSLRSGAYSWDLGPHAFYSKDPAAMRHLRALPLKLRFLRRDVRVCHHGSGGRIHEVGYPFENGLCDLPLGHRLECVAGYWAAWNPRSETGRYRNLKHWIEDGLGSGISRRFMTPYNGKIWSVPLERVSMELVRRKIEPERPWAILKNSVLGGSVGRAYQAEFVYPEQGAGAVPEALAAGLGGQVRTGWEVRRVERREDGWRVVSKSGEEVSARALVSTIPVPEFLSALDDPSLRRFVPAFSFNHTRFVLVGLKPGRPPARFSSCQWVFFAGPEVFYRVSLPHNFTARPEALVAEITLAESAGLGREELLGRVVRDLAAAGLIGSESSVETAELHLEKYTYPIPTVGMPEARAELEERLASRQVRLLGRSGRWDYLNTDGVLEAVEAFWLAHEGWLRGRDGGRSA